MYTKKKIAGLSVKKRSAKIESKKIMSNRSMLQCYINLFEAVSQVNKTKTRSHTISKRNRNYIVVTTRGKRFWELKSIGSKFEIPFIRRRRFRLMHTITEE